MPYGKKSLRSGRNRNQVDLSAAEAKLAARAAEHAVEDAKSDLPSSSGGLNRQNNQKTQTAAELAPSEAVLRPAHHPGALPLRERPILASRIIQANENHHAWASVSHPSGSQYTRPNHWYSAKACAKQYSILLESAEMPRKQQV